MTDRPLTAGDEPSMPTVELSGDALVKIASGEVVTWSEACRRLARPATSAASEGVCSCNGTGVIGWGSLDPKRCPCRSRIQRPRTKSEWPAEREVGRTVYERVEKLVTSNPQPGTSDWAELDYLSHLAESVEEVGGYDGPLSPLASPPSERLAKAALQDADDISGRIHAGGYRANLSDVECLRNHVRKLARALTAKPAGEGK